MTINDKTSSQLVLYSHDKARHTVTTTFLAHKNADIEKMPSAAYNSYALWKPINLPSNISNLIKKQIESVEFLKFQSSNLY